MQINKPLDNQIVVYTSESQLRKKGLLRAMWQDLYLSRELAWRLFVRDISAQYRQSFFGVLWAFIPPIATSAIFIFLQTRNIINFGETDIPYPVYVLISTILWQVFTESLNAPLKAVTTAKPMLVKINFPREALILSSIGTVLFNLLIKLALIIIIFFAFKLTPTWGLLLAIYPVVMLLFLGIGIGLLITPIGMLYTDIATSLPLATQLLFFVTPVVYPPPTTFPFSLLSVINPISPFLIAARDLITTGTINNLVPVIVTSIGTVILLFIAWVIYRVSLPIIIERLSA
jgi:lipopolysaccharide transport system permease protein